MIVQSAECSSTDAWESVMAVAAWLPAVTFNVNVCGTEVSWPLLAVPPLSVTVTSTLAPYPDLQVANLAVTANPQSGQPLTVSWNDANTGQADVTKAYYDHVTVVNLSTSPATTLASADVYYDATQPNAAVKAGGSTPQRQYTFTLPNGATGVGSLQVTVTTDYYNYVYEYNASGHTGVAATADAPHPIVPAFERFYAGGNVDATAGGRLLLGELNCVSCHLDSSVARKQATVLDDVGARVRAGWLKKFLTDPSLYNNIDCVAVTVNRMMPRLQRILKDFETFADKLARHPELLGARGVVAPSDCLKNPPTPPIPPQNPPVFLPH